MRMPNAGGPLSQPTQVAQQSLGLSLSPAAAPFPHKLVTRVQAGEFVEMRDLLSDNMSLLQQLETLGGPSVAPGLPGALKPRLREVSTLPTWLYCFLAYVAIRTESQQVHDMLAYARLIIREAQRHGGVGWLDYDRVFRQQMALDPSLRWNTLDPGIQASTLVGRAPGQLAICSICREPDHGATQCALAYMEPPQGLNRLGEASKPASARPGRGDPKAPVCASWNRGGCTFPGQCHYKHVCAVCRQPHMARDCSLISQYSVGNRPQNSGGRQGHPLAQTTPKPTGPRQP